MSTFSCVLLPGLCRPVEQLIGYTQLHPFLLGLDAAYQVAALAQELSSDIQRLITS
jgi:hypothetical protein